MDLPALIAELSQPPAYPFAVGEADVRQTHISVVFLAGDFAYKIKKPVQLPFLDFSTLELRRRYCEAEVRLNRRLAPDVYLGVVPVTHDGTRTALEGTGDVIDWAVKMRRLPEDATLEQRLLHGEIDAACLQKLATRIAGFHAVAERNAHIATFGSWELVSKNVGENLDAARQMESKTISHTVLDRLSQQTNQLLESLQSIIIDRAAHGIPCDTHGDLHLDHVYIFPEQTPPGDLVIVDCIEFNERFRFADPIADMAFLVMDLKFHGRHDLARVFAESYFAATGDDAGRQLLPLYSSYRAAIRAKVDGMQLGEREIPELARSAAAVRARAHWLLALHEVEVPDRRPCLLLVGGLPGTGKSTLARALAEHGNFQVIRSDVVRKELAGTAAGSPTEAAFQTGIYTSEWTNRTYSECRFRAEQLLFEGARVIVDATFSEESKRREFLDLALRCGVPTMLMICETDAETVQRRLRARHGDASDADWSIYCRAVELWQPCTSSTSRITHRISTVDSNAALATAQHILQQEELL